MGNIMSMPFERRLKKASESEGSTIFRSAGSRAVDLIAIHSERGCFRIEEKSSTGDVFRITKTKRKGVCAEPSIPDC